MKKYLVRNILATVPFAILPQFAGAAVQGMLEPVKPNLIIILTDDQGYADVGFNGCKDIPTPNLDRIAANGVVFTNGYVTYAVCGPSRAGLITGRYQDRFGSSRNPLFTPNDPSEGLPLTEETLADVLGREGYTSSILGKWHLGAHRSQYPLNRGFDEFFGFLSGGHQYFPELWTIRDASEAKEQWDGYKTRLMRNNGRVDETEYLTDALSREAVDFVERHADKPFFLYLAYNAPHTPMQATEKYLSRFGHIENERRRTYAAMVSAIDDGVGLLLDKIEALGINHNTMVFFLSDNGGAPNNASDNTPLRGVKGHLYDGGIRVPFAMQWPGKVPAGQIYEKPIISLDIFATIVAQANATPKKPIDGVNLIPYVTAQNSGYPHEALFWRQYDRGWDVVLTNEAKYHVFQTGEEVVYNIYEDIGENNPIEAAGQQLTAFRSTHSSWHSELMDPTYLGLMRNDEYNRNNPDRFVMTSPYEADILPPQIPKGYTLIWSDEFNSDGVPNETYWSHEHGFVRNNELQWYQPDNARVQDGLLVIEGKREQIANTNYEAGSDNWRRAWEFAEYSSSSINTRGKFSFQYGILEVRARVDTSMGSWPAIWTLGVERRWPSNGEIDVMEYYRYRNQPTILANAAWGRANHSYQAIWDSSHTPLEDLLWEKPDWPERFHIWKMDWTEDYIRLYLNDVLLNEVDVSRATYADGFNPFRQPHYILLNLALGSNGGDPSNTDFPLFYEVDYVRVYQKE
jgi:arylsulfatase A-like enzyme/beta-glucanase (GH16 family)